ncbi:MAG: hypothetical protein JW891_02945 [Candidatus Lokiarchaeota archaeon]|nr:hypothetical protein [Candidatus Lokiarchaeota archaeon]
MEEKNIIKELARKFRKAILECDSSELPLSLANFPSESCADASTLLGSYLNDNNILQFDLIKGIRGEGSSFETHYWLEKDNLILDITADQFDEMDEEIILTEVDSNWHKSFKKEKRQYADHRIIGAKDVRDHLSAVYDYILEKMD